MIQSGKPKMDTFYCSGDAPACSGSNIIVLLCFYF